MRGRDDMHHATIDTFGEKKGGILLCFHFLQSAMNNYYRHNYFMTMSCILFYIFFMRRLKVSPIVKSSVTRLLIGINH